MRSPPVCFGWFSLLAVTCSLTACGSGHDDLSKRLASMQTDLTKLQNHSDRLEERLEALETGDDTRDAPPDAPTAELRPEDSAADTSPRPMIRVHGSHSDGDSDGSDSSRKKH
jgi:hypothetical protein